jgi:hypothetical protein
MLKRNKRVRAILVERYQIVGAGRACTYNNVSKKWG